MVSSKHPLTAGCFDHFLKVHKVLHGCSRTDADWTSGGPFGDSWLWLEKMLCHYAQMECVHTLFVAYFSLVKHQHKPTELILA